jgi:DNA-binding MarR family transcriptional regulator
MVLVEITERGREVTDIFRPLVHRHERDWLAGLTASEKTTLLALLARVQAGLVA